METGVSILASVFQKFSTTVLIVVSMFFWAELQAAVPESSYADLHWRQVGPFRGGWATAVAGHPHIATTFYFGSADGGVWKTDNAGVTWKPLFEQQGSASIGALAIAPSNPDVIWVGTGQIQQRWDIVDGDGVYRSTDGGKNWLHVGLDDTRHIGDLWVDPENDLIAVVAALGHVFGPNRQRGLFRTEDGGKNWTQVLYLDDTTGAADLAFSADTADTLYASLWQVQRHPWLDYFQPTVGGNSSIYRSTDGGRSWKPVPGAGLPGSPLSRIEIAVAPGHQAKRVWASVGTADGGGLYRSEDGGANWILVNDDSSLASDYMSWLTADPQDDNTVWAGGQPLRRSVDGGKTFNIVRSSPGGDDYHALWIDPTDSQRMITGADQGAVVTFNGGESWSSWFNQPTGQFYRVAVDNGVPYRIYSGQQDSGTVSIASRSDYGRISFRDWNPVGGDERDGDIPDPTDADIVYGAGLGGRISKWRASTAQVQNVSPWPVSSYAENPRDVEYRYDWITPLAISAAPPHAMYTAAQVVFRSTDRGQSWQIISPDLTGIDPAATGCTDDAPVTRATACGYASIFALAPSPLRDGLIWVGTNNGRLHLSRDGGENWQNVTPPGLEDWSKISLIDASAISPDTAYLAIDRHRLNDFTPRAYVTHDAGKSWREIGHGLPAGAYVKVVREDPGHPGLLYAGTSRGVHVSFDDGEHWQSLQLDLPTTGVNDLLVHEDDLVIATQGRALWVLDAIAPLRHLSGTTVLEQAQLIEPEAAIRLRFNQNKDTPLPPEEPTGENPPAGAVLDYLLPADFEGQVRLEILTADGRLIRSFDSEVTPKPARARIYFAQTWLGQPQVLPADAGHHRFIWNLRYMPPPTLESRYSIAATPGKPTPILPEGAFVLPGTYTVRMIAGGTTVMQKLDVVLDPRVGVSQQELAELLEFQQQVTSVLNRAVTLQEEINSGTDEVKVAPVAKIPARVANALTSLAIDLEHSDSPPTISQQELLEYETRRFDQAENEWKGMVSGKE
jgi:photosystem II stability/assembly factor-like uncharacterized protein